MIDKSWPYLWKIIEEHNKEKFDKYWSCYDFSNCKHIIRRVSYIENWQLETCVECGNTEVECAHNNFEWNKEGTLLRCKTCGRDGT